MGALPLGANPCSAVFDLIAEGSAREVAINLTLALAMTADDEPAGDMGEADAVIRLIRLLTALPSSSGEVFLKILRLDSPLRHTLAQLFLLFRGDSHESIHPLNYRRRLLFFSSS